VLSQYLLYIDILGFRELALRDPAAVDDLYRVIASLNAHKHDAFRAIVFSHTFLVHNEGKVRSEHDHDYLVMFLCEFAQDLQIRLVGRDVAFRGVLLYGEFEHYLLNRIHYFFGPALIRAYDVEKRINATGLFIDDAANGHNRIFSTRPFDDEFSFVYLTPGMRDFEDSWEGTVPLDPLITYETDFGWVLGPEIMLLERIYRYAQSHPDPRVRQKYLTTWWFYTQRYPCATTTLLSINFELEKIGPGFPWSELRGRYPEDYSFASKRTRPRSQAIRPLRRRK
jgi:hypothetical protein